MSLLGMSSERSFLLQRVQPAMTGLIDKTSATLQNVAVRVEELGTTQPVRDIPTGRSRTTSFDATVSASSGDFCLTFTPTVNGAAQPSSVRFCSTVS